MDGEIAQFGLSFRRQIQGSVTTLLFELFSIFVIFFSALIFFIKISPYKVATLAFDSTAPPPYKQLF